MVSSIMSMTAAAQHNVQQPVIPADARIEKKVEKTLSRLTLEEKVGQMMEVVIDLIGDNNSKGVFEINER